MFKWTVTVEDPVFFTHPFTLSETKVRMGKDVADVIRCADNEGSPKTRSTG
jgi:hypothetical protein